MRCTDIPTPPTSEASSNGASHEQQWPALRLVLCGGLAASRKRLLDALLSASRPWVEPQLPVATEGNHEIISPWLPPELEALLTRRNGTLAVTHGFITERRRFLLSETPTQEPTVSDLCCAAVTADLAVLLVDAQHGLDNQLRRQAHLLSLLGVRHLVLAIDIRAPMASDEMAFSQLGQAFADLAQTLQFSSVHSLPLSTVAGDSLLKPTTVFPWYQGPTLLDTLEQVDTAPPQSDRVVFPVLRIDRSDTGVETYAGRLLEGQLKIGDALRLTRTGQTARIIRLDTARGDVAEVTQNAACSLTLDPAVDAGSGDILSLARLPLETTDQFEATLVWLDDEAGLIGRTYDLKLANQQTNASLTTLKHRLNLNSSAHEALVKLERNDVSICTLATGQAVAFDTYAHDKNLGSFLLLDRDSQSAVAFGMLNHSLRRSQNVHAQALTIRREHREAQNGHSGKVIWFTGLSGSGKSTLANALEVELHGRGYRTYVLDGDNVRQGLNKDLGFTDADRVENIRRIAEVAKLMMDAGLIVLTAFISPFRQERKMARELVGEDHFIEVYVSTPLEVCEQRDVKGLYKKARAGQLPNLSGVGSPYEPPTSADQAIDAAEVDLNQSIMQLLEKT